MDFFIKSEHFILKFYYIFSYDLIKRNFFKSSALEIVIYFSEFNELLKQVIFIFMNNFSRDNYIFHF